MEARILTAREMSWMSGVPVATIQKRLWKLGVKPCGWRVEGGVRRGLFPVLPQVIRSGHASLTEEGWVSTTEIADQLHTDYRFISPFLETVEGVEKKEIRWGTNKRTIWKLPEGMKRPEVLRAMWRKYNDEQKVKPWQESVADAEPKDDRVPPPRPPVSCGDSWWLRSVPPGPVRDMVLKERRVKGLIGKEVEVRNRKTGMVKRGILLWYNMMGFEVEIGGIAVEFRPNTHEVV